MAPAHMWRALALCALVSTTSACTFGVVQDANTQAYLGGAVVTFRQPDMSSRLRYIDETFNSMANDVMASLGPSVSAATWSSTQTGSNGGQGAYYLNPYGKFNAGDSRTVFVSWGWQRVTVAKAGYDTRVFYRNHQYTACDVPANQGPYSAGPYPYVTPTVGPYVDAEAAGHVPQCAAQNFQLYRNDSWTDYIKDPDIIVDLRSLRDHQVTYDCADIAATRCLRVSVATANVGMGPLVVRATAEGVTATQVRSRKYRWPIETALSGAVFEYHGAEGHDHIHLLNWSEMRLRRITSSCNTELTATNCSVRAKSKKIGFCLRDYLQFDSSLQTTSTGYSECGLSQGIRSGWMDLYAKGLDGQAIPLDGLSSGEYWLEVEVNPVNSSGNRTVIESDYTNNITRLRVRI